MAVQQKQLIQVIQCRNKESSHDTSFFPMFTTMLAIEAYVPKRRPATPSARIRKSFTTHTCHGHTQKNLRSFLTGQNVTSSRRDGKMKARALLATAPISAIRSSRSGTARAMTAGDREEITCG